jgi:hypothetical protein
MGAGAGIRLAGESASAEEMAFLLWLFIHKPLWVTPTTRSLLENKIAIKNLANMKTVPKSQFLQAIKLAGNQI